MSARFILIGILLLANLTLSGCVWYGGHGSAGYYGYSHDHGYKDPGDWDRGHHGSERGFRNWR